MGALDLSISQGAGRYDPPLYRPGLGAILSIHSRPTNPQNNNQINQFNQLEASFTASIYEYWLTDWLIHWLIDLFKFQLFNFNRFHWAFLFSFFDMIVFFSSLAEIARIWLDSLFGSDPIASTYFYIFNSFDSGDAYEILWIQIERNLIYLSIYYWFSYLLCIQFGVRWVLGNSSFNMIQFDCSWLGGKEVSFFSFQIFIVEDLACWYEADFHLRMWGSVGYIQLRLWRRSRRSSSCGHELGVSTSTGSIEWQIKKGRSKENPKRCGRRDGQTHRKHERKNDMKLMK